MLSALFFGDRKLADRRAGVVRVQNKVMLGLVPRQSLERMHCYVAVTCTAAQQPCVSSAASKLVLPTWKVARARSNFGVLRAI
eukprot:366360-Chlamydomonas_euryale.AAC.10